VVEPEPRETLQPGAVATLRDLAEKMLAGAPAVTQFGAIGAAMTGLSVNENAAEAGAMESRMRALTTEEQARVRKLIRTTSYGWHRALMQVEAEKASRRNSAILPEHLATLNLPLPTVPKGRKLTRRQRRK